MKKRDLLSTRHSSAGRNPETDSMPRHVVRFNVSKNPVIAMLSDQNGYLDKLLAIGNWIPACAGMTIINLFRAVVGLAPESRDFNDLLDAGRYCPMGAGPA